MLNLDFDNKSSVSDYNNGYFNFWNSYFGPEGDPENGLESDGVLYKTKTTDNQRSLADYFNNISSPQRKAQ